MSNTVNKPASTDQLYQGICIIVASTFAMAFGDAIIKLFSADLSVWQVFAVRSAFAIPCLFAFTAWRGTRLQFGSTAWVFIRSLLLTLTWLAYYASFPVLSLSVAAVAIYSNPIITALLSAVLLRERVSNRQWLGVLTGFAGVAVILKPGTDAFSWAVLLPLLGAALYSLAMVLTRSKCQRESAVSLAVGLHVTFLLTGVIAIAVLHVANINTDTVAAYPFLLSTWPTLALADWATMLLLGLVSAGFAMGVARAYQIAPPQIIGTFDYSYLVSATLWGLVFFSETPDGLTILGMILITGAGLLVASRSATQPHEHKQ